MKPSVWRNALEHEGIDPDTPEAVESKSAPDDLRSIASDLEAKARWLRELADELDCGHMWRDVGGEG